MPEQAAFQAGGAARLDHTYECLLRKDRSSRNLPQSRYLSDDFCSPFSILLELAQGHGDFADTEANDGEKGYRNRSPRRSADHI